MENTIDIGSAITALTKTALGAPEPASTGSGITAGGGIPLG